jgi:hypothetical protein
MRYVTTTGRTINLDKVTFALLFDKMLSVQTAGYNQIVNVSGPDFEPFLAALISAGFVGENTLINPERVAAWEDAGTGARVYLEGADRSILMPLDLMKSLSSAGKGVTVVAGATVEAAITVQPVVEKTPRKKKAE